MTFPGTPHRTSRHLGNDWALPALDESNRPFFISGRIALRVCADCGAVRHPPQPLCSECQGSRTSTRFSMGVGTVHSRIVVHHAVHPALADAVPYCVALVSLDDFPETRIVGNVLDVPPSEVRIGMRVRAVFERVDDGGEPLQIPQWAPFPLSD